MVALDANTGRTLWKTYVMPDNHALADGYSGGAIWQPVVIDTARGSLYFGTGNNYQVPATVKACVTKAEPARSRDASPQTTTSTAF